MAARRGAENRLRFERSISKRIPTDRYYSHRVDRLRLLHPGTVIPGKKNAKLVRDSFEFQPAIGIIKGADGQNEVDTLIISEDRYQIYESAIAAGSAPLRITYAAGGGMNSGSTKLERDQDPNSIRNAALRRFSASTTSQLATVWVGTKWLRTGMKKYTLLGLYSGDGTWVERRCPDTSCKYWTIGLVRSPDQFRWRHHMIDFGDA